MKNKILIALIMGISLLPAQEIKTYNIKKALYGEYSYEAKSELEIFSPDGKTSKKIPVKIIYKSNKLKKVQAGFKSISSVLMRLTMPNNIITETKTETTYNINKEYQILTITEKSITDGNKLLVTCKVVNDKPNKSFEKKIGFKSEKINLNCSDGTRRSQKISLNKGINDNGILEITQIINSPKMKMTEIKRLLLKENGTIEKISGKIDATIFKLNYSVNKIKK